MGCTVWRSCRGWLPLSPALPHQGGGGKRLRRPATQGGKRLRQGGGGRMGRRSARQAGKILRYRARKTLRRRASLITPPPWWGRGRGRGGAPDLTTPSFSPSPTATLSTWAPSVSAPWARPSASSTTSRPSCPRTRWTGGSEGADVIKRLEATYLGDKRIELLFSDGSHGVLAKRRAPASSADDKAALSEAVAEKLDR